MPEQRELDDGRYVLDETPIASGGMGTVWRGFDRKLRRAVAVKELRFPEGLGEREREERRARVITEAWAAARLDHPGIVSVYDVVEEDGRPWIVMRLVSGRSLAEEVVASGPLDPRRTARIGLQILDALSAAHAQEVLHRDVKPQNVLLDAGDKAVLGDFGIAVVAGVTRPVTETGLVIGTVGYVAPERLSQGAAGPASDLWSLGATLYYAAEGRHAYDTGDVVSTIAAVVSRDPEPMRHGGALAPVVAALMARDPERRPTAEAAAEQLEAVAAGRTAPSGRAGGDTATRRLGARGSATRPLTLAVSPPPAGPGADGDPGRRGDRPSAGSGARTWGAALAASVVLVAGGFALGLWLGDDEETAGATAGPAAGPAAGRSSGPSPSPTPNRFTTAPKVCQSDLLSGARLEDLVSNPEPGAMLDSDTVNRCEWETEDRYLVQSELSVRVLVHGSGKDAGALFKDPAEVAQWSDAKTTRPALGDEAVLVTSERAEEGQARVRISNLTIEVRHSGDFFNDGETLMNLMRELVTTAEADPEAR
jgi:hypothetical protein